MKFLKTALVRGLIGQVGGTILGMGIVCAVRLIFGMQPIWKPEPAWALGGLVGAITFMIGTGVLSDWFKWMRGISTPDHPHEESSGWLRYFNISVDHKVIGIQYGVTSMLIFLIAGLFALIFRTELLTPAEYILGPSATEALDFFNSMVSLHGMLMIAGILLGVGAMSNYLVPLLIGASDMAFPRLNAFAYWINVPGAVLVLSSLFLGGVDAGWTAYPPLSSQLTKLGFQTFFLGVYLVGLSSITGGINVIVTTLRMRAKGMSMFKMPIFVWAAFATALIQFTATQLIGLSFQLVMFQRLFGMNFFNAAEGGNPVLYQHLFWFYSHPAVYVFILPGLGIISELLPVFSRKPLFGYKWIAMSSLGIALIGFFVWAHHMFTSGMNEYLRVPFMYTTLLVAVPTGVKFFSWVGTMWQGKLSFSTPMLFVLGSITIFLLGGISGPPNGTVATDLYLHDTYWVVGHFHATMFGGYVFPFFAAIYYWYPKFTGRMYNEALGKIHFWLMFPGFYVQSLSQMWVGLLGMRRRIGDYDPAMGLETGHLLITVAGYVIGFSVLLALFNLLRSLRMGAKAADNPWRSRSPEFQLPSPVPQHNYADHPFEVIGEPYDYGLSGSIYAKFGGGPSAPASAHHPKGAAPAPAGD
ncbi:MAG: cbb3-type cytochrome c oxidase subunit I [Anaerolineales bacterium]|nr:cbb3-type cytochrome c oxidase subunit I [Anaerolineales bacterium]